MKTLRTKPSFPGRYIYWALSVLGGFLSTMLLWTVAVSALSTDTDNQQTSSTAKVSTLQSSKPKTTQNAYKIKNDGTSERSTVLQYDSKPAFKGYQDNDSDGRFGERETSLQDLDSDGRKGERERQLGNDNVTQNQKVTTLNNMGFGSSLSTFKASGQTRRSSIFTDEPKSTEDSSPSETQPSSKKQAPSKTDDTALTTKTHVLVS